MFIELLLCDFTPHSSIMTWALLSLLYTEENWFKGFIELAHEATVGRW